ncbi:hypothetical protein [Streptomyces sp. NPDC020747]|uniref:hypothetical protein n=1 Tax=Streptomyces sp. NPDC020747 TaxID=3365086 RepID=UPI0037BCE36D
MTTATETPVAESTVKPEAVTDLPGQVDAHMREHFPDTVDAGGWMTARDYRDNTAVVVWRPGDADLMPGGIRAILIYRWHVSLQNAGFTCVPRTDMEVFGRPDEQAPDGRARWIHITGWDPELVRPHRSFTRLEKELRQKIGVAAEHQIHVDPASVPPLSGAMGGAPQPVHGLRFQYAEKRLYVTVVFKDTAEPLPDPPACVLAIAEEHRGHGTGWDGDGWCRLQEAS